MNEKPMILLLGRDEPTDGVVDYCEMLREAGTQRGLSFDLVRVPWAERGWRDGLAELREQPKLGAITGFFSNTRHWRGRPVDFLCVRLVFSMSCGKAALALA